MKASHALLFATVLGFLSVVVLWIEANMLTALLSVFALLSYVFVYTPMKRRTPLALVVGAVPGAMPPLLGWTAARGAIDTAGLVLFAILLVWQIPHFIAISFYYREDYEKAGICTVPGRHGDTLAKLQSVAYATLLVPVSLMFVPLGFAGPLYFAIALGLGVWFAWFSLRGFSAGAGRKWARKFFIASLVYLPALTAALLLDIALNKYFR
jgi:protoheme IX farnesyltransferase